MSTALHQNIEDFSEIPEKERSKLQKLFLANFDILAQEEPELIQSFVKYISLKDLKKLCRTTAPHGQVSANTHYFWAQLGNSRILHDHTLPPEERASILKACPEPCQGRLLESLRGSVALSTLKAMNKGRRVRTLENWVYWLRLKLDLLDEPFSIIEEI